MCIFWWVCSFPRLSCHWPQLNEAPRERQWVALCLAGMIIPHLARHLHTLLRWVDRMVPLCNLSWNVPVTVEWRWSSYSTWDKSTSSSGWTLQSLLTCDQLKWPGVWVSCNTWRSLCQCWSCDSLLEIWSVFARHNMHACIRVRLQLTSELLVVLYWTYANGGQVDEFQLKLFAEVLKVVPGTIVAQDMYDLYSAACNIV